MEDAFSKGMKTVSDRTTTKRRNRTNEDFFFQSRETRRKDLECLGIEYSHDLLVALSPKENHEVVNRLIRLVERETIFSVFGINDNDDFISSKRLAVEAYENVMGTSFMKRRKGHALSVEIRYEILCMCGIMLDRLFPENVYL